MSKDDKLPPELRELHNKMTELIDTTVPVELTAKELAMLGAAINAFQEAVGEGIREAPDKRASQQFVRMLAESGALADKLETAMTGVIRNAFGTDDLPDLDALMERMGKAPKVDDEPRTFSASADGGVGLYL